MLTTLDVPASAIRNPTCVGRLSRRAPLAVDDLRFVQQLTHRPVKVTLPGPYLLTRAMWVGAFSSKVYADKQAMGDDVVGLLREELVDLRDAGAAFVQFDETEAALRYFSPDRIFLNPDCGFACFANRCVNDVDTAAAKLKAIVAAARALRERYA